MECLRYRISTHAWGIVAMWDESLKKRQNLHARVGDREILHDVTLTVGTELSHEAAVGKIARDEIDYLVSRGLDEEVATATIIRGFLDVKIQGLPDALQQQIEAAIDVAEQGF